MSQKGGEGKESEVVREAVNRGGSEVEKIIANCVESRAKKRLKGVTISSFMTR